MEGDIIYVVRKPLFFKPYQVRKTERSGKLDQIIARTVLYKHYGVEVEDGNVIHFHTDSITCMKEGSIRKTTMEEFLLDGEKRVDTEIEYKFSRNRIMQRAYSRLNTNFDGYHISNNNCEHFAVWCANGNRKSKQVYLVNGGQTIVQLPKKAKDKISSLIAFII